MTDDDRRIIDCFRYSLTRLHIDDDGLTPDNTLPELNAVAYFAMRTKAITAAGDSPEELLLHRLAELTGDLLVTPWLGDGPAAVREWLIARGELLELMSTV